MLRDFNAKDNAVRVGYADGLHSGEFSRQVVEAKRWFKRVVYYGKLRSMAIRFLAVDWAVHDVV